MPLGITFLVFLAKNPAISQKLGLVSAKANLVSYSATDWTSYLALLAEIISAGGFFFFIIAISWVFGREFADGTIKDLLAVPVRRGVIVLAKFITSGVWSAVIGAVILVLGFVLGGVMRLPGASAAVFFKGLYTNVITIGLIIAVILPYALFASLGRGYILPMALAVLTLVAANLIMVLGLGDYFPWAIPILYAQGQTSLQPVSFVILLVTSIAGMILTYLYWKYADHKR